MSSISLRAGTPTLRLRSLQSARVSCITAPSRALYSVVSRDTRRQNTRQRNTQTTRRPIYPRGLTIPNQPNQVLARNYSTTPVRKPTADLLIEEIQDLYEIAKDEFEIATESTDGATIYAASDRESARDALNQLCAVYHLYTARPGEDVDSGVRSVGSEEEAREGVNGSRADPIVETNFNPEDVASEVRDEVRRRIGQRIRELRNAVEILEERAHAE
ncbi:hypothetical protein F1880_002206 [Penicillium rolfsii]|nr:hypothetical protein F1880_002206 [Penicillium rolfsii]